jgi:hypothetical protein
MNQILVATLRKQVPRLLAAFVAAVAVRPAFAQDPPRVDMSLASGQTISLGEPIVLDYTITNRSTGETGVYLGHEQRSWLTIYLLDDAGRQVGSVTDTVSPRPEGLRFPGARVQRGRSYRGRLVVGQWLAVPRAGRYTLRVQVRLPYAIAQTGPAFVGERLKYSSTVVTTGYDFPFTVTPSDPDRLRSLAGSLRQAAIQPGANNVAAINSLFSLPEAYALPSWQALIRDPRSRTFRYTIGRQLERVSPEAAATLRPDVLQYWYQR